MCTLLGGFTITFRRRINYVYVFTEKLASLQDDGMVWGLGLTTYMLCMLKIMVNIPMRLLKL